MDQQSSFPPTLDLVAPNEVVHERVGWQLGSWGACLAAVSVLVFVEQNAVFGAVLLSLGAGLLFWERRRRENRTAVVVRGARLGIYRKGRFDMEVGRPDIIVYSTNWLNTIRFLILPIGGAILGAMLFVMKFGANPGNLTWLESLTGLPIFAASVASFVSLIYTRHVWHVFRLPRKGKWSFREDFNCDPRHFALLSGMKSA